jgi:putative endonuclease
MHSKIWYVYMLLCNQKTFYIGITNDLINRIKQHKNKQSFFTKKFSDVRLIYCERYQSKHLAAIREKQIKGWSRAKKQMLIKGKLGINTCTEFVEALLVGENLL